jgi:hypothetical protein
MKDYTFLWGWGGIMQIKISDVTEMVIIHKTWVYPSQILRLFRIFLMTKSLRIFSKAWAVLYLAMLVGL